MNQRNNNQTDKYSDMLKWLSDKIKYTKNGRMYEDYYKVSEEYQKDKESNNSYVFKTIFYFINIYTLINLIFIIIIKVFILKIFQYKPLISI